MKKYTDEFIEKCRFSFVEKGKSLSDISFENGGNPKPTTLLIWALKKNKSGRDWFDEREIKDTILYDRISPKEISKKIYLKMAIIIGKDDEQFSATDAKILTELQKSLEKITDLKYHLAAIYQVLTDLMKFIKTEYPKTLTPNLIEAIKSYKNLIKEELER